MAVLIEQLNLIVRVRTLLRKYPGGLIQYRLDTLKFGFCSDGLIARVGSGSRSQVETLLESLKGMGFVWADEFGYPDVAIVDEHHGFDVGCFWLETGRRPEGLSYAFLPKTDPTACIAVPSRWTLERREEEQSGTAAAEPAAQLLFLRRDGAANVFLNRRTGQQVRIPMRSDGACERLLN
ncbi:MAG: hypothetical protein WD273_05570 [Trueperaceae bacterium]